MINLLPPETKKQIRAARFNIVLRRYCFLLIFVGLLLGAVFAVGFWATFHEKDLAAESKAASEQSAQQYAEARKAATDFAKDLSIAKNILGNSIRFSQLLTDIASVIPSGVILSNLSLGASTATTPVDISARAKTSEDVIKLKNSLEASPIFENVNITNINRADPNATTEGGPETQYPYSITLKVQFSKTSAKGAPKT